MFHREIIIALAQYSIINFKHYQFCPNRYTYTHRFCDILLAHEREPRNSLVRVDLHDLKTEYNQYSHIIEALSINTQFKTTKSYQNHQNNTLFQPPTTPPQPLITSHIILHIHISNTIKNTQFSTFIINKNPRFSKKNKLNL